MFRSSDGEEQRSGFLEKLVIVAIILLLAVLTGAVLHPLEKKLRAREDCKAWARAVDFYILKHAAYPPSLATLTEAQPDGTAPFMEASLRDPWGHEYQYCFRFSAFVWSWGARMNDPDSIIGNWE
jgi:hypothetical protein